jgi:phosphoribosyl-ATP pyrophosphohydrolase/phosphoribosyl-AMP cyclohydrolase
MTVRTDIDPSALSYGPDGLIPVIVQEVASGAVLMVAWADREAVERTLSTGEACFWSRSRRRPWRKGETSGHTLAVVEAHADCDGDALLLRADPRGPTCHRGVRSCFDPAPAPGGDCAPGGSAEGPAPPPRLELGWLAEVVRDRAAGDPATSYTARLLAGGAERAAQKVGEEAVETVIAGLAAADGGGPAARAALAGEAADLLYHLLVLLAAAGLDPGEVAAELRRRHVAPAPAGGASGAGAGTPSAGGPQ